jgi:Flp pilus assembly protein TadG
MNSKFRFFSPLLRLGKDRLACSLRPLARLLRDEEGSYLLFMSVLLPVVIGVAGLGAEGGLLLYNHRTLQSAADAAAYSAAIAYSYDTSADIEAEAKAIVRSYGYALGTGPDQADQVYVAPPAVINPYANSGHIAIQVTASRPQTRYFSGYWIKNLQPNDVSAIAIISGGGGGNNGQCLMSLSPTGAPNPPHAGAGILLGGTSTINATNCGVFSNSTASNSILVNGASNQIIAGSVGTAGAVTNNAGAPINPQPTSGDGQLSDPYAGSYTGPNFPTLGSCLTPPVTTGTGNTNLVVPPSAFPPGTYCTNIEIVAAPQPQLLAWHSRIPQSRPASAPAE